MYFLQIVSKAPITNMTVTGETLLKHGELVDLNIDCTGSAPWLYCVYKLDGGYNITGKLILTFSKLCHFLEL